MNHPPHTPTYTLPLPGGGGCLPPAPSLYLRTHTHTHHTIYTHTLHTRGGLHTHALPPSPCPTPGSHCTHLGGPRKGPPHTLPATYLPPACLPHHCTLPEVTVPTAAFTCRTHTHRTTAPAPTARAHAHAHAHAPRCARTPATRSLETYLHVALQRPWPQGPGPHGEVTLGPCHPPGPLPCTYPTWST